MIKDAMLFLLLSTSILLSSPGDLLQRATFLNHNWSDLTEGGDGTIWMVGLTDGKIYHADSNLQLIEEDTLNHPFGAASPMPPFQPVSRGIAYDSSQNTFFILNGNTMEIVRCSAEDGIAVSDPVALQPPGGALLTGLSYNVSENILWSVDSEGDQVIGFNPDTGEMITAFPFPGDIPQETIIYGSGISFLSNGIDDYLYILWGDIFQERADTAVILNPGTGQQDPFSIPLSESGEGVTKSLLALSDSILVLLKNGSDMVISKLDSARPFVLPPSTFTCVPDENGNVELNWVNNGPGSEASYDTISIRRNGATIQQIPGNQTSYLDINAPAGQLVYEIQPSQDLLQVAKATCKLQNKRGAILNWIPFPGGVASGLAVNPDTGNIWITDSRQVNAGTYRIWEFTPDLELVGSIEVNLPGAPYGITFWPDSPAVSPPETLMIVSNDSTNTVQKIKTDGTLVGGGIPLRLDNVNNAGSGMDPKAGSLAFDPDNGDYFLAVLDRTFKNIVWVNENGIPADESETTIHRVCKPLGITGVEPEYGLAKSPASGFIQIGIKNGSIHEIDGNCNVTTFDIDTALPHGDLSSITAKDFDYIDNSVYITSPATNSIFKLLAYTIGNYFIRGDCNGDNTVDIADVISILQYLFEESPTPECMDAADANDDGNIDVSDPVYLLFFLFGNGEVPPNPYPDPGSDPTLADDLSC